MTAVAFDTLKLAKRLEGAGFTREQASGAAEALADTFSSDLATKADFASVRTEIAQLRAELKGDIAKLGGDLRGEIAAAHVATVRWIVGAVVLNFVGVAGLILGVLRLARP